jgi:DNA-binding response OmpR family regulator
LKNILVCDKRLTEHREFIFGLRKQNISPVFEEKVQDLFELLTVRQFSGIVFGFGSDDETGLRLIEWVRSKEELSNIPIITLGSDSGNCEPEKIIEAGADDFFPYPYIITELVSETAAKVNRYEAYKKRIQLAENEVPGFEEYEVVNEESKGASSRKKRLKHILIIEDDIPLCENLEMHLKMNSFTVTKADRGLSGIEMASLRMPDLIICDIMLPDIDGFLVLEQLNKKVSTSSIPFIFLSAKSEISDIRRGMILGANSYVTKPFSATKLLQLISSQLEKTKYANILKHRSELYPNDVSVKKTIEMLIEESKRPSAFTPEKAAETRSNLKDLFKRHSGAHPTPEPVNQPEEKKVAEPEKEEMTNSQSLTDIIFFSANAISVKIFRKFRTRISPYSLLTWSGLW